MFNRLMHANGVDNVPIHGFGNSEMCVSCLGKLRGVNSFRKRPNMYTYSYYSIPKMYILNGMVFLIQNLIIYDIKWQLHLIS